jgi:phosphate transport system ATP-binding protein
MSGPLRIVKPGESARSGASALSNTPIPAGEDVVLHLDQVAVSYHGRIAIREGTFDVRRGRITALIGPSGCGKSSLLQSMNRLTDLIPGARVDGQLHLGGLDVLAPETDVTLLRRRVGMIFQKPNPFPMSIRANLALPLREHGVRDRHQVEATIEGALHEVGLWNEVQDRLDSPAQALSGGQQQRLCIARALVLRPEVILLDEPCSALDPIASGVVEDLVSSLRDSFSVVIVTHNLAQARRIADDVVVLWACGGAGCLAEVGSAKQIFEDPQDPITRDYVHGYRG